MHVIVVGAGFAGLGAARRLADEPGIQLTLVDQRNHHLFQALLYQVATAGLSPGEIASPVRSLFRDKPNVRVMMAELTGLDRDQRKVLFDGGSTVLEYDALILCLGAVTSYFGHPEWAEHAPGLKSLEEALALRHHFLAGLEQAEKCPDDPRRRHWTTVAVIGGGPTGVELAGAFAELCRQVLRSDYRAVHTEQVRVVLVEGGPRVLAAFPEPLSRAAEADLRSLGVEVWLQERVEHIGSGLLKTSSRQLEAHTIVWAAGIQPHPLAAQLGLPQGPGGRVQVNPYLQVEGHPEIFCAGDLAGAVDEKGQLLAAMAPVAIQAGPLAAENALAFLKQRTQRPFHYRDSGMMATVGRRRGVAVMGGRLSTGSQGWLTWLWHHLLRIVDRQNQALVLSRWVWSYFTWKWGVRLIHSPVLAPPGELPNAP